MPKANRRINKKEKPPYNFSDEATKRKIRRHINDINDVITDKDIKNAKVPGTEKSPLPAPGSSLNGEKKQENPATGENQESNIENKNKIDDSPGNPTTSWDVLQE